MKPKVLHLLGSLNQGGSERQAAALASELKARANFDVRLATLDPGGILRADLNAAGFNDIAEYPLTSFYDLNFLRQISKAAKWLKKEGIDVVHTHDFYSNVFGMAAARLAGTRVRIASKRETGGMRTAMQQRVEKAAFRSAHRIVVNAAAVSDHLVCLGIDKCKHTLIYNGIDLAKFKETDLPKEKKITTVANLRHSVKNIPMLLRAAAIVVAEHPDATFNIAGEGDLIGELAGLSRELGIERNVVFLGRSTNVPELLADSYACTLTSSNEGFSNSILEYMAAGRPAVVTDVGGAREAIEHGTTGYIIPSNDHQTLAKVLIDLLSDPEKAAEVGRQARSSVIERFSRKAQADAAEKLYAELLKK